MAGKGDKYRPVDPVKWSEGWDRIFGKGKQDGSIDPSSQTAREVLEEGEAAGERVLGMNVVAEQEILP